LVSSSAKHFANLMALAKDAKKKLIFKNLSVLDLHNLKI